MKITNEAKELLLEAMKTNDADCILVNEIKSCCGSQLTFSLARSIEGDAVDSVDGVPFLMDASVKIKTDGITIRADKDQLFIRDENSSTCAC